jgi:hypothetical protein
MRFFKGVLAKPAFAGQELEKIYQKRSLEAVPRQKLTNHFPLTLVSTYKTFVCKNWLVNLEVFYLAISLLLSLVIKL